MEYYLKTTAKELSQRKKEEYEKYCKIRNAGLRNPVWFVEFAFGIQLIDYQSWCFMNTWNRQFALWLEGRATGKTTLGGVYLPTRMLLIPDYKVYVAANSASQSVELFKKIEDIALQRIPSFRTCTDLFAAEIEKPNNSDSGFIHNPAGHHFRLFNDSELITISTNIKTIRGHRGAVFYDEIAWGSPEFLAATEHFAAVDSDFGLGTDKIKYEHPRQMPLQLLYSSSAGDVEMPFYDKYKMFAKKMIAGDPNYFVCDINANTVVNFSTVKGEKIKPHLTQAMIDKAIEEDPELAERELFNRFHKGAGANAIIKPEALVRNSVIRAPLLRSDDSRKRFILTYDPARGYDGSILSVWEVIEDDVVGYKLRLVNVISMVDTESRSKTPLPMKEQLKIIQQTMIDYNGDQAAEWENIEFYIDAGAGGGGVSAVADQLLEGWTDEMGVHHRGIIDPTHKQYETARRKYPDAAPILHLVEPTAYKRLMYNALEKMVDLNLIEFTDFDGKEYILLEQHKSPDEIEYVEYYLSAAERTALLQINLMKNELSYICRYVSGNGNVSYELAKDKRYKMHDDRAYTAAMGAYALSNMRRTNLINKPAEAIPIESAPMCISAIPFD